MRALRLSSFRIERNRIILLEGIYNSHVVQLLESFRADPKLKPIMKGFVQMPFLPSKALDTCVRQQNEMPLSMGRAALYQWVVRLYHPSAPKMRCYFSNTVG